MRYRAILAYDGTAYQGFQRQAGGIPTVQGMVEHALARISGRAVTVLGAGRTDSGVHASGQVIAFDLDHWAHGDEKLLKAINANLPDDIALQAIQQQPGFHPRYDALARGYRYHVLVAPVRQPLYRQRAWHIYQLNDVEAMQRAAALLIGEHDFAAFGTPPQGTNTVRAVYRCEWRVDSQPDGLHLFYHVEATAFLYQMVRRMVGMMVAVGRGQITLAAFEDIFRSADLSRAKHLAPAQGLVLELVRYPENTHHTGDQLSPEMNRNLEQS